MIPDVAGRSDDRPNATKQTNGELLGIAGRLGYLSHQQGKSIRRPTSGNLQEFFDSNDRL